MNPLTESPICTVPLALTAHSQAEKLRSRQTNSHQAKQVYLNTLAVHAVQTYLQWRGFDTDWKHSDSASLVMQNFMDVADLNIINLGKLECRFVLPEAQIVTIPEEVWSNRLAFIGVRLSKSLREATLLGFLKTVSQREIPLTELRPIEELIPYLCELETMPVHSQETQLSQWFDNIITAGWETLENLFTNKDLQPAFNFRRAQTSKIKRGKRLNLESANTEVILTVCLIPSETSEIEIAVEVFPANPQTKLPSTLQVMILDEMQQPVMTAEAGESESLEFQLSAEAGEKFSVKVVLEDASVTEDFTL
jgi:hypothetical protein